MSALKSADVALLYTLFVASGVLERALDIYQVAEDDVSSDSKGKGKGKGVKRPDRLASFIGGTSGYGLTVLPMVSVSNANATGCGTPE